MRYTLTAAALAATVLLAAPASGATALLTGTSTTSGNSLLYTVGGVKFSVTGVTYGGSSPVASLAPKYSTGLGVNPSGDDRHTVDNSRGWDFLLFRFDQKVALNGAVFSNGNWYNDPVADTDASISWANYAFTPGLTYASSLSGSTATTFLSSINGQLGSHLFSSNTTTNGTSSRTFNNGPVSVFSNVWIVGASTVNADGRIDSFKLKSISYDVGAPVPEPATWAMLILGFGIVGGAMRRRQTKVAFA